MDNLYRKRRTAVLLTAFFITAVIALATFFTNNKYTVDQKHDVMGAVSGSLAIEALNKLKIGKNDYTKEYLRDEFGSGWSTQLGCDTRNIILNRDLTKVIIDKDCNVISGILDDPYSGKTIKFKRGSGTSGDVQIDHVVALSDAWKKGAQNLTKDERVQLANDPLELLAVDGQTNMRKSDADASGWLPPNKSFRCQYVAVKLNFGLWLVKSELLAMKSVLTKCPNQMLPNK